MLHHFSHVQLCVALWTIAHQAPLSKGFSRQEYWSRLPFPPPGDQTPVSYSSCIGRQVLFPPGKPMKYIYIIFFRFFSLIGYYKILRIAPYVIQQVLVGLSLSYSVYVNPNLSILMNYEKFWEKQIYIFSSVIFNHFGGHRPLWDTMESYGLYLWNNASWIIQIHTVNTHKQHTVFIWF